jgi:LysR family transcriptional activator of dmlA
MSILDDTSIFFAIVQQGGFSRAAKHLGLSNGLISRRITNLEKKLGVSLIKRTTRQFYLTPEGELFWEHAQRIQQELNSAISLIHSSAKKPKGTISISAPTYFGRTYLAPIIAKFLANFNDININLVLTGQQLDPIKEELDLVIRGVGYLNNSVLKESGMKAKLLIKEKIRLYASQSYLSKYGEPAVPDELINHAIINYINNNRPLEYVTFTYRYKGKKHSTDLHTKFNSNDIDTNLMACIAGRGIGKFTDLNVRSALQQHQLKSILSEYDWGDYHIYAIYSQQQSLPKRTRLLLDFIAANCDSICSLPVS